MIDHSNNKNWIILLIGACSGIYGFWQLRKGVAYGKGFTRYERAKNPWGFWVTVIPSFGFLVFTIVLAITHWHSVTEGFAGRKPVDERISKAKRVN